MKFYEVVINRKEHHLNVKYMQLIERRHWYRPINTELIRNKLVMVMGFVWDISLSFRKENFNKVVENYRYG